MENILYHAKIIKLYAKKLSHACNRELQLWKIKSSYCIANNQK
jgi:hypothetical protein